MVRFTHPIPETPQLVNVGCFHFYCALLLPGNREEGKGVGGLGEGTLGPYGPFPQSPASGRYVANCSILSAAMNGVFSPTILFVLATCAGGTAPGVAQHGCAAVGGPNYERVCPSREARTTIGCRGSFERTEKQFARSGSALGALLPGGRVGFTIRFSFLPNTKDQFAQLASHSDLGLLLVGSAAMRQAVV